MTKTLVFSVACALFLGLMGDLAEAAIDKKALLGKWSGHIAISFGGKEAKKVEAKLEFKADGTLVSTDPDGKTENAKYKIKGDKLVIMDEGDKEEIHVTKVKITATKLEGDIVASGANKGKLPPGAKVRLILKRVK